jgi:LysM repeat protein
MQSNKQHIDFDSIPDGLEFRQEYLDAALGKYRQTKRAIYFKRLAFIGVVALLFISGSVGYLQLSTESQTVVSSDSTSTQTHNIQNTSPTIDLEPGEGTSKEHRTSPAVESSEATQDLSSRTTDLGDSMSSGVELPGQLSHSKGKVWPTPGNKKRASQPDVLSPIASTTVNQIIDYNQQSGTEPQVHQALAERSNATTIAYLPLSALSGERQLRHNHPTIEAPYHAWNLFALVGVKAWADHGFQSRPFKMDASAALGFEYAFSKKLSGQFLAQFNTVSGVADPYVVEQVTYGQGYTSTTYRYFTDRFYETGAGVGAMVKLTTNHSIGLGWSTRYLLTADNHIETGLASTYESLQENRVMAKGYVQGFAPVRHSLRLNYEYALGKNKSLGACYEHGLTDVTKNNYFGNEFDRNSMLSVYFRLKLVP